MAELLAENPLLLLFGLLAVGSAVGAIRVKGFSLGAAAVLFAGLAVSAWDAELALPAVVGQLGLAVFAYTIGVTSGPSFFSALRTGGRALTLVVGVLVAAAAVAVGVGKVLGLSGPLVAGLYSGALTNTPALAAAVEQLDSNDPTVGYSVTYLFGVLGMVWAAALALRARGEEAQAVASRDPRPPELVHESVRVDTAGLPMLGELIERFGGRVVFSRVMRDDEVYVATDGFVPVPGDVVAVIGARDAVEEVVAAVGHRSGVHLALDRRELDFRRVAVSNMAVAGRTIGELRLLRRFGATATRVRRGDVDLLATDDLVLQLGDRLRVVAPRARMPEVARLLGDSERGASDINPVGLSLGLALGLLVGAVEIGLPGGATFELGLAAGPLVVGLVLGRLQRTGPVLWSVPYPASASLGQFGMLLFLAYAGSNAGDDLAAALQTDVGLRLLAGGAIVTGLAAAALLLLGPRVADLAGPRLAGTMAGSQTQPAVLAFANERSVGDPRVNLGYALVFPAAMIVKVLIAPIVGAL
ncbi:MAG: TrkA C-terminal domain-containing protein [Candidatus Nanopelagicales bacterium]